MCKYHIVFTPKYRRKEIYNQVRKDLIEIFKRLCKYKGVEIIEGHMMPDHVHMFSSNSPKNLSIIIYGISEGKKLTDDIREACQSEV
ncbi:transposase [Brevibacillus sp. CF112]|nr:transposase [Brevibacillus sp. CF112]